MATKTAKKPAAKKAAKAASGTPNLDFLTKAGVVPRGYDQLSSAESKAIESLSKSELNAIVATKTKLGRGFFPKHASHGMLY